MEENPLDLEQHEEETLWDVWKRRLMFALLIALCIAFAAPTFGSCTGALGGGSSEPIATYRMGGNETIVTSATYQALNQRLSRTFGVMFNNRVQIESEDQVWQHLLLDAAAREAGIHVSDDAVLATIADMPDFQKRDGTFDEQLYRDELSRRSARSLTHKAFTHTLKERLRIQEYIRIYQTAFAIMPSADAFESWRESNMKLSIDYVVQPFDPLRAEVESREPTDEELRAFARLPQIEIRLRQSSRKTLEVAYARVADLGTDDRAQLETLLRENEILAPDADLRRMGAIACQSESDAVFTRANWLLDARAKWTIVHGLWKPKADAYKVWVDGGKVGDGPGEPGTEPPLPDAEEWPTDFLEQYDRFWEDRVVKEILARGLMQLVIRRSEAEGKSFSDLMADYEAYGLRVAQNETPLEDKDLGAEFPHALGQNSELGTVARSSLRGPEPGTTFVPVVHPEPVPTTQLASALDDRGYMALRLAAFEPSRVRELDEAREEIVAMWREHQVREDAKANLDAVLAAAKAGASLKDAAAEAGLPVSTLRRFNRQTAERSPPIPPAEGEMDAATKAVSDAIRHRNRMLRDYAILRGSDVGSFREPVLLDNRSGAAYLIQVTEKHDPSPLEMTDTDLQTERISRMTTEAQKQGELFELEALKRRFQYTEIERARRGDDEDGESDL